MYKFEQYIYDTDKLVEAFIDELEVIVQREMFDESRYSVEKRMLKALIESVEHKCLSCEEFE
jgi:hypothetical protein